MNVTPSDSTAIVAAHVLDTLPDSHAAQDRLLHALFAITPPKHPARAEIARALDALVVLRESVERAQLKFAAIFNAAGDGGAK